MTRCPSDLELESQLIEGERSPAAAHVQDCPNCQRRMERMRELGNEFRREVLPATLDAVLDRASDRPLFLRWLTLAPIPIAATVAIALLFVVPLRGPKERGHLLGDDLALRVFTEKAGSVADLADGQELAPAAELRFFVHPCEPCRLWVISVDGRARVSRLYPAEGELGLRVAADVTLPGRVALGGPPGPERIFAVCSEEAIPFADIQRAAQAAASGGDQGLRAAKALPGLPRGVDQVTLLLEKRRD